MTETEKQLRVYRRECLKIANDFQYPEDIIDKIINAPNEAKLVNIMTQARKEYL